MDNKNLVEIKKSLDEIHKTLKLVFLLIGFFAFLYFGLLLILLKF